MGGKQSRIAGAGGKRLESSLGECWWKSVHENLNYEKK